MMCPLLAIAIAAAGEMKDFGPGGFGPIRSIPPTECAWAECVKSKCAWWTEVDGGKCALRLAAESLFSVTEAVGRQKGGA